VSAAVLAGFVDSALATADGPTRGGVWFVTLTFHPNELDEYWPAQAADIYAYAIANDGPGCGAILAWDVSPKDRSHLHGFVVSRRSQLALDQTWQKLSLHAPIAEHLSKRIQPVTGSRGPWCKNRTLASNVRQILKYMDQARAWPRDVLKPKLSDRLVVSGIFEAYDLVSAPPQPVVILQAATAMGIIPSRLHARRHRQCEFCRVPLPVPSRSDRRTCGRRCRVAKHRQDRAVKNGGAQ
jgi:hypothetical protein